jgi:hypothetical protein
VVAGVGMVADVGGSVDRWVPVPARAGPTTFAERIALDQVGGNSENWSVMVPLVPFAARPRSR